MTPRNKRLTLNQDDTLFDEVPVKEIFVDMQYARPINAKRVEAMADSWNRKEAAAIILSMRDDGRFACIDGFHRTSACRLVEGEEATLPALIYIDLTEQDEAELFAALNAKRSQVGPAQRFKAHLASGQLEYIAIYRVVQDLGLDLAWDGQQGENVLQAVASVERVARDHGLEALRDVLKMLRDCFGTHSSSFSQDAMKGLAAFLARYGDNGVQAHCDMTRLRTILMANSIGQFKSLASTIKATNLKLTPETCMGMAILTKYNEGLRSNHLPPWQGYVYLRAETRESARQRADTAQKIRRARKDGKSA